MQHVQRPHHLDTHHQLHLTCSAGRQDWPLLLLGLVMPAYALRYVFFGTRWGSNSSFAMVNLLFTSLCPAKILLPCPDSNPVQCQLKYPKMNPFKPNANLYHSSAYTRNSSQSLTIPQLFDSEQHFDSQHSEGMTSYNTEPVHAGCPADQASSSRSDHSTSQQLLAQQMHQSQAPVSIVNHSLQHSAQQRQHTKQDRDDLHFPVLVPLWHIYVREKPLPIFLHTLFMTVAALLWPLQVGLLDNMMHTFLFWYDLLRRDVFQAAA